MHKIKKHLNILEELKNKNKFSFSILDEYLHLQLY